VTDIYATAFDYNRDAKTTQEFFKLVQNKLHYAVHRHTAAELIVERADAEREHMGLTTWEVAPQGKPKPNLLGAGRKPKVTPQIVKCVMQLRSDGMSFGDIANTINEASEIKISKSTAYEIYEKHKPK
jgi:RIO-like serine/threonine protein kinase